MKYYSLIYKNKMKYTFFSTESFMFFTLLMAKRGERVLGGCRNKYSKALEIKMQIH